MPLEELPKRRWGGGSVNWRGRFRLQRDLRHRHDVRRRSPGKQRSQRHRLNGAIPKTDDDGNRLPRSPSMPVGLRALERRHQQGRIGLAPRVGPGKPVLGRQKDDDQGEHERDPPFGLRTGLFRRPMRSSGRYRHVDDNIPRRRCVRRGTSRGRGPSGCGLRSPTQRPRRWGKRGRRWLLPTVQTPRAVVATSCSGLGSDLARDAIALNPDRHAHPRRPCGERARREYREAVVECNWGVNDVVRACSQASRRENESARIA